MYIYTGKFSFEYIKSYYHVEKIGQTLILAVLIRPLQITSRAFCKHECHTQTLLI